MTQLPRLTSVRLRVHHLDKLASYYENVVGLQRQQPSSHRLPLGASPDAPPVVTLEEAADAPKRPRKAAGLFHLAIRLPTRHALAQALRRIEDTGHALRGASDHRVSEALYLRDPEGNGIEIYRDRPIDEWPTGAEGQVRMETLPLDLDGLRAESDERSRSVPGQTDLGHVHLEVSDTGRVEQFCRDVLGMKVRARQEGAVFLAWGDYHHHIAANTWRHRSEPARRGTLGLAAIRSQLPSRREADALGRRAREMEGVQVEADADRVELIDADGLQWVFGISGA